MYIASLPWGGPGWASVIAAVIIAAASLVVSHILVRDLAIEERNRMEVWAEAMRSLSTAEENTEQYHTRHRYRRSGQRADLPQRGD